MIKDKEVAMVSAGHKALEILEKDPTLPIEEIIQKVMSHIFAKPDVKIVAISAVNSIVKLKRKNPDMSDKQVIQEFISTSKKLEQAEEEEEIDEIEESLQD
jgi:hypothetical protein